MHGWSVFLILVFVALIIGGIVWIAIRQLRARRLGLPPPPIFPSFAHSRPSNPSSITGKVQTWLSSKIHSVRNPRSAGGAYESTGYGGAAGTRGRAVLDPDEAWDARVGNEAELGGAYYEEQEVGLHEPSHGAYNGGGYGGNNAYGGAGAAPNSASVGVGGIESGRGRSRDRQRELDSRYEQEVHGSDTQKKNPFGDKAERSDMSLRGVSPRPMDAEHGARRAHDEEATSPNERRTMFRENV